MAENTESMEEQATATRDQEEAQQSEVSLLGCTVKGHTTDQDVVGYILVGNSGTFLTLVDAEGTILEYFSLEGQTLRKCPWAGTV